MKKNEVIILIGIVLAVVALYAFLMFSDSPYSEYKYEEFEDDTYYLKYCMKATGECFEKRGQYEPER